MALRFIIQCETGVIFPGVDVPHVLELRQLIIVFLIVTVWLFFVPILSALLGAPFDPKVSMVFFYPFRCSWQKHLCILLFFIKSILYGIWKFQNKTTLHDGKENSKSIMRYIIQDIKN